MSPVPLMAGEVTPITAAGHALLADRTAGMRSMTVCRVARMVAMPVSLGGGSAGDVVEDLIGLP